jgi:osmotically-inducible protein OsmY
MFLWDPDRGKGRRTTWSERAQSRCRGASEAVAAHSRDLSNRARGAMSDVKASTEVETPPTDEVLTDRVRSRLGHLVTHAHSLDVAVDDGIVTISGPVASGVEPPLVDEISRVPGVRDVETDLREQELTESTPELRPHRPRAWFRMRPRGVKEPVEADGESG